MSGRKLFVLPQKTAPPPVAMERADSSAMPDSQSARANAVDATCAFERNGFVLVVNGTTLRVNVYSYHMFSSFFPAAYSTTLDSSATPRLCCTKYLQFVSV